MGFWCRFWIYFVMVDVMLFLIDASFYSIFIRFSRHNFAVFSNKNNRFLKLHSTKHIRWSDIFAWCQICLPDRHGNSEFGAAAGHDGNGRACRYSMSRTDIDRFLYPCLAKCCPQNFPCKFTKYIETLKGKNFIIYLLFVLKDFNTFLQYSYNKKLICFIEDK